MWDLYIIKYLISYFVHKYYLLFWKIKFVHIYIYIYIGQNGLLPLILEIFCLETLFPNNIAIYHFLWYSNLVSSSTIFLIHCGTLAWKRGIKYWLSTRASWARVLFKQYSSPWSSSTIFSFITQPTTTDVNCNRTCTLFHLCLFPICVSFPFVTVSQKLSHSSMCESEIWSIDFTLRSLAASLL